MVEFSRQYDRKPQHDSWDELIGELAGRQHGVISLGQLLGLGLNRRAIESRVRRKRLLRLHRGVYTVGHTALTHNAHLIAAVYACGSGAVLSHRSAAGKQGLVTWSPRRIDVTVCGARAGREGIAVHRSRLVHPDERTTVDRIPVTTVARTLVDLAEVLNDRQLTSAVRRAEILKTFDLRAIEATIERLPGRKGRHRLNRVLVAFKPDPHLLRSRAEHRLKALCTEHRLPMPQFNANVAGYEVDVYWPEAKLVLEFDGAETHQTRFAFHNDRRRDRALAAEGIQVARVTWPDLAAPLAEQVRAIMRHR